MPFIGRDWRSPGEAWVKTETLGWQRMKLIESQLFSHPHNCASAKLNSLRNHKAQNQASCVSSWPPNGLTTHFGQLADTDSSSSAASTCSSASVSPTNSPHRSHVSPSTTTTSATATTAPATHFIHPIAISSPYGHFSCTCSCKTASDSNSSAAASVVAARVMDKCTKLHSLSQQSLSTVSSTSSSLSSSSSDNHVDDATTTAHNCNKNKREQSFDNCDTCWRQLHIRSTSLRPNRSLQSIVGNQSGQQEMQNQINQVTDCLALAANQIATDNNKQTISDGRSSAPPQYPSLAMRANISKIDGSANLDGGSVMLDCKSTQQAFNDSMTDLNLSNVAASKHNSDQLKSSPLFNKAYETIQYDNTSGQCGEEGKKEGQTFERDHCNSINLHTDENISETNHVSQASSQKQHDGDSTDGDEEDYADEYLGGNINHVNKSEEQNQTFITNCCCRLNLQQQHQQYGYPVNESVSNNHKQQPPYCRISVRTREVAMYNTISEAFYRLDFYNAIHDIRRFNYICKLLHLLITQNLTTLSGCATKVLFTMLEQVAWEVSSNKRNIHVIKNLLAELKQIIQKYYCWGRPIGSSLLWQQHFDTIQRISQIVDGIELSPLKSNNDQITFDKLPVEMVREILLRLNDYRDLVNSAQASPVMKKMINSQYIWKRMCRYHFTDQQVKLALKDQNKLLTTSGGKKLLNSRGIKYARTVTADGQGSFRNRVTNELPNDSDDSTQPNTNRNQSNSSHRNANDRSLDTNQTSLDPTNKNRVPSQIAGNTPPGQGTSRTNSSLSERVSRTYEQSGKSQVARSPLTNLSKQQNMQATPKSSNSHNITRETINDIDWGRIFHQLRKRFDLKEEYADCLLLCRHCRCLFWKSFGHPCVNEEQQHSCGSEPNNRVKLGHQPDIADQCASVQQKAGVGAANNRASKPNQQPSTRPSVASLSRDFDNMAQNSTDYRMEQENGVPSDQHNNLNANRSFRMNNTTNQEFQNDALLRRLNERRARLMNLRHEESSSTNRENIDHTHQNSRPNQETRKILVPEHVTITPQAFLKFFSL